MNEAPKPQKLAIDPEASIEADLTVGDVQDYDGLSSASTSLSDSVRDYNFENNRRYHKFREGSYHFPNDEPEQTREDMKHAMIVSLCDGRLHFAPLKSPEKILDVGTGTGIWAIDSMRPRCPATKYISDCNSCGRIPRSRSPRYRSQSYPAELDSAERAIHGRRRRVRLVAPPRNL